MDLLPGPSPTQLRRGFPAWPLGLEEPESRLGLARRALDLAGGDPAFLGLAQGLAAWTWQRAPLAVEHCRLLEAAERLSPFLPPSCRAVLTGLSARLDQPFPADDWAGILASDEQAPILRHLLPRLRDPGSGPVWLAHSWDWLLRLGRADLPRDLLEATAFEPALHPLRDRLLAEWAFFYAPPGEALVLAEGLSAECFGLWRDLLRSELCAALGFAGQARDLLVGLRRRLPWHPHLALKLHALIAPDPPAPAEARDVSVLLYSWNKAGLLRDTLAGLAASDLRGARVAVLDNGSGDETPAVLREAAGLFPEGRFQALSLPVNVGAPAARNWLLALPEVRACRYAVFLDDDVVLPPDWLGRLLSAAAGDPEAATVGCRIVSAKAPACLQSADYNPLPGRFAVESYPGFPENIHLFENTAQGLDLGLFSYSRRALSVSGCCHLLRLDTLDAVGGFDLRFSPTQFDDLERDLRTQQAGLPVRYAGTLAVGHVQHSSLARARTPAAVGQVVGNKIKLECLYDEATMRQLAEGNLAGLWADYLSKERDLVAAFGA